MAIELEHICAASADAVWAIVGTPDRTDWVPGVESCTMVDGVRTLTMTGAGRLRERIIERDAVARRLVYSVIESTPPLEQHRASIDVSPHESGAKMIWRTKVEPVAVERFIVRQMQAALARLDQLLAEHG
jgi:hypothetical protein